MLKKWLIAIACVLTTGIASAQVDVNKADQAQLEGIKGVGPSTSKTILDERKKGEFKDWADFEKRVKGIGDKRAAKLSQAGLTVNGQPLAGAPAAAADAAKTGDGKADAAKSDSQPAKKENGAKPAQDAGKDKQPSSTSSNPFTAK